MGGFRSVVAIALIWAVAAVGWMILGGVTQHREATQSTSTREDVQSLWGSPQSQSAPQLTFNWETQQQATRTEQRSDGTAVQVSELVTEKHASAQLPDSSHIDVDLRSDLRRKGLIWYSLYDVQLAGDFVYKHTQAESGQLAVRFGFPDSSAVYDGFTFLVNGKDFSGAVDAADGSIVANIPVAPGDEVKIALAYKSRGLGSWRYLPTKTAARIRDFQLNMTTHFRDIDFPEQTLSPSAREATKDGWKLSWRFEQIVTGFSVGMIMPQRVQPGELASELAYSAPISLFFYFLVIYVLATLRRIDLHPVNYFFLAGAFYAFHLLFAYAVDHFTIETTFVLCSVVSIALVVSYLRLVVSARFALREAALAQLLYLVGFSLAHFWEGFTGLTVTVLAIITLFALMQLTGRVKWSEVFSAQTEKARA
ncbi:MAG TPA: inner membrane CreD family protein [Polyangiales bacterium]|nr:inner membrane CreD family protein [Polyangiales bacterium]